MPSGSADPHIIKDTSVSSEPVYSSHLITTGSLHPVIALRTDQQTYNGAKSAASHPLPPLQWTTEYKINMIFDTLQEPVIRDIISQLRIHQSSSLNGFPEIAADYVQTIPTKYYETAYVQYPIITAIDKTGTETEKSMLLAAILSYAGYDTALLSFPKEDNHQAVGIKSTNPQKYPLTDGYAVIETKYIGLEIGKTSTKTQATVSKVGTGTKKYLEGTVIIPQAV